MLALAPARGLDALLLVLGGGDDLLCELPLDVWHLETCGECVHLAARVFLDALESEDKLINNTSKRDQSIAFNCKLRAGEVAHNVVLLLEDVIELGCFGRSTGVFVVSLAFGIFPTFDGFFTLVAFIVSCIPQRPPLCSSL